MTKENKQLTGIYMGKEWTKKTGTDKNGDVWKLYKCKFDVPLSSKVAELLFSAFDLYCKGYKELEEGMIYLIKFEAETKFNEKFNKDVTYKTANQFIKQDIEEKDIDNTTEINSNVKTVDNSIEITNKNESGVVTIDMKESIKNKPKNKAKKDTNNSCKMENYIKNYQKMIRVEDRSLQHFIIKYMKVLRMYDRLDILDNDEYLLATKLFESYFSMMDDGNDKLE